ncbi:MAG: hypothetical protein C4534_05095 [Gaiellales bacterium]|nr:MAG: hypothetical protein C4534_05095 [Gaiellales bacterium]
MMVKRAVLLLMVLLAAGLAMSGTMAWFQDSASSSMSTFKAGSLGMLASDDDDWHVPVVDATWVMENMQPCVTIGGDAGGCDSNSYTINSITYENHGSVYGNHVELSFAYSGDTELARYIHIIAMTYDGVNIRTKLADTNGNGFKDLADLVSPGNAAILDNLLPPKAGVQSLTMELGFSATAGNDMMGKSMIMTATATLNQDASQ